MISSSSSDRQQRSGSALASSGGRQRYPLNRASILGFLFLLCFPMASFFMVLSKNAALKQGILSSPPRSRKRGVAQSIGVPSQQQDEELLWNEDDEETVTAQDDPSLTTTADTIRDTTISTTVTTSTLVIEDEGTLDALSEHDQQQQQTDDEEASALSATTATTTTTPQPVATRASPSPLPSREPSLAETVQDPNATLADVFLAVLREHAINSRGHGDGGEGGMTSATAAVWMLGAGTTIMRTSSTSSSSRQAMTNVMDPNTVLLLEEFEWNTHWRIVLPWIFSLVVGMLLPVIMLVLNFLLERKRRQQRRRQRQEQHGDARRRRRRRRPLFTSQELQRQRRSDMDKLAHAVKHYRKVLTEADRVVSPTTTTTTTAGSTSSHNNSTSDTTTSAASSCLSWRLPKAGVPLKKKKRSKTDKSAPTTDHTCSENDMRTVPGSCVICFNSYQVNKTAVIWSSNPECPHVFCQDCILEWLVQQREQKRLRAAAIAATTNSSSNARRAPTRVAATPTINTVTDHAETAIPPPDCPCCRRPFVTLQRRATSEE